LNALGNFPRSECRRWGNRRPTRPTG
jgi:hypothetical protein